ncbi:MAG: hypothetical protein RL701_2694 [Pseudomonadota bacterium]
MLCGTPKVSAHAGPQVRTILFDENRAQALLVANRGLIFGSPGRGDWQLMCNEALHVSTSERFDVVALPEGKLLAATALGLLISEDRGCNWHTLPELGEQSAPALTQHPSEPSTLYLTTYAPPLATAMGDDADAEPLDYVAQTGLRESKDGGATWRTLLPGGENEFLRYIRSARSDPRVLYLVKLHFGAAPFTYSVLRSEDAGSTWREFTVAITERETDLELLGVSPYDPYFLVAKAHAQDQATTPERLLVSHDGGEHFETITELQVITDVDWSADRDTLWIAADAGLYRSTDAARSFERVGTADLVSCVITHDGKLLSCGWYDGLAAGMPGVGVSSDGGATFASWMHLNDVLQPLQCPDDSSTHRLCAPLWVDWQREILGLPIVPVAGASGAGGGGVRAGAGGASGTGGTVTNRAGAAAESAPVARSSGCAVGGSPRQECGAWLWLVVGALVLRLRARFRVAHSERAPHENNGFHGHANIGAAPGTREQLDATL